jgi:hypothetical protein
MKAPQKDKLRQVIEEEQNKKPTLLGEVFDRS